MRSPRISRHVTVAAVLAGLLLAASGCDPLADSAASGRPDGAAAGLGSVALEQLNGLRVGEWSSMAGYKREKFPHWSGQGGGCDTRDVVLKRDGRNVVATSACKITQGTWVSAYDGMSITDPQEMDIDHMVPLANAWRTGAAGWTDGQREEFANDLTRPQLIAVTATTNRSKGDQDPSQWKPPRRDYWCVYAQSWVAVKAYWKLTVRAAEKAVLQDMLGTCP